MLLGAEFYASTQFQQGWSTRVLEARSSSRSGTGRHICYILLSPEDRLAALFLIGFCHRMTAAVHSQKITSDSGHGGF